VSAPILELIIESFSTGNIGKPGRVRETFRIRKIQEPSKPLNPERNRDSATPAGEVGKNRSKTLMDALLAFVPSSAP